MYKYFSEEYQDELSYSFLNYIKYNQVVLQYFLSFGFFYQDFVHSNLIRIFFYNHYNLLLLENDLGIFFYKYNENYYLIFVNNYILTKIHYFSLIHYMGLYESVLFFLIKNLSLIIWGKEFYFCQKNKVIVFLFCHNFF